MTADADSNPSDLTKDLYQVVDATIEAAETIVKLRFQGIGHPLWETNLEPLLPERLRKPFDDWKAADDAAAKANYYYEQANEGYWYNGALDEFERDTKRCLQALKTRRDDAEALRVETLAALRVIESERSLAQNELIAQWLKSQVTELVALQESLAAPVARHEMALAAISRTGGQVGQWKATSHCAALLALVKTLIELLTIEAGDRDYFVVTQLQSRFYALDKDAWKDLKIAAQCEAASLAQTLLETPKTPVDPAPPREKPQEDRQADAKTPPAPQLKLDGSPAKTLATVVIATKGIIEGRGVPLDDVVAQLPTSIRLDTGRRKKAAEYLGPSSSQLVRAGRIRRESDSSVDRPTVFLQQRGLEDSKKWAADAQVSTTTDDETKALAKSVSGYPVIPTDT